MSTPLVRSERRGAAQWITIDRPAQRNAFNDEVVRGIAAALSGAQADAAVRAVVLTGAGDRAFCAGGDLGSRDEGPFEVDPARPGNAVIELFRAFERCGLPTIARVNGHALAGGLGLACACDMAVVRRGATLGVPETGVGLFPMMILPYLARTMPRRKLLEWCITGVRWTADEALEAGLVNYVVEPDELDAKVEWLLERVTRQSPTAIRLGKMGWRAMQDMSLDEAFEYAQLMLPTMARTEDAAEGRRAFREKRDPAWTGR
ncbi:MAG: enoyl-CoA hydratase-related protein [Myxococcota bacterium]|nr:enoyl-CoA hydratase/isomerase family protein [Myxococcales bacterium]